MVLISVLNNALNSICNAEKRGKRQVLIRPASKVVIKFLTVMQKHGKSSDEPRVSNPQGYIQEFEIVDDHRAGKIVVFLNGRLNKVNSRNFLLLVLEVRVWFVCIYLRRYTVAAQSQTCFQAQDAFGARCHLICLSRAFCHT